MLKFIEAVATRRLVSGVPAAMCTTSVVMVAHLLSYNYTKPGYLTTVTCFHNASSNWHLGEIQPGKPDNGIPYIYYAIGYFPNAVPGAAVDFFSVVGLNGKANIAVLAAKHAEGRNIILITAGSDYPVLNRSTNSSTSTQLQQQRQQQQQLPHHSTRPLASPALSSARSTTSA
jgi:hypothetical protein